MQSKKIFTVLIIVFLSTMACGQFNFGQSNPSPSETPLPTLTPTSLPPAPVKFGEENPNEPVFISGEIPYTSPFFLETTSEAFVMLEDETGFIHRDKEFVFPLNSQVIGPVELINDKTLNYQLELPAIPQGTLSDLDHDEISERGVQVFAIAYWSNTWGGPFLEPRDGQGWSTAYASTITDPDQDYEITGGTLVIWSPDDQQEFPSGFGDDGLLFTDDDPVVSVPPGYSLVDLNVEPFHIYKEAQPKIDLVEGAIEVNDYSNLTYKEAFDALFDKVSVEYPFTKDKAIDWQAIYDQFEPEIDHARTPESFFLALHDFSLSIPDGHIGIRFNDTAGQIFFERYGGSFGMILTELSDGRVIVSQIFPDTPATKEGITPGTEIIKWNDKPIDKAISETISFFGPYSTKHTERLEQLVFLTRVPPNAKVDLVIKEPNSNDPKNIALQSIIEYDSLFAAIPTLSEDRLALPIEGKILEEDNLGYIKINSFSEDYNLTAQLWDRYINELIDADIDGIILDLRVNGGGNSELANDIAGYFFFKEITVSQSSYYNHKTGEFEVREPKATIKPGPKYFDKPIAVLISPYCVSACEGFSYALALRNNTIVAGHYPTAGAYGEVGRGQYDLPDDFSMQFPTGRSEKPDGSLLIEGKGVIPDVLVPITESSALGLEDTVLNAAIKVLLDEIG
ncbi:MAG: hypothetical protein J7L73_09195 [Anaerolineales bacterium]|nr:hypothetical protein [Anaerolineales bacterium]